MAPTHTTSADPAAFGGLTAQALAESGRLAGQRGEERFQTAMHELGLKNEAAAKDADIEATKKLTDLQYNPDSGFMNTKGRNAVDGYKAAAEAAQKVRADTLATLTNPEARRMADRVLGARVQSALQSMAAHSGVENRNWQLGTSDARAITSLDAASLQYNNDVAFEQALKTAHSEALAQGEMQGWGGPEAPQTKLRMKQYTDAAWTKRFDRWRMQDPVGALAAYQRNAERMGPEIAGKLGESLFKDAAPALAAGLNTMGGPPISPRAIASMTGTRDYDANFNTKLSAEDEVKFQEWKKLNAPNDSGVDYDLRGAFKAGLKPAGKEAGADEGHWPDTYKKPNHPTFSNESRYAAQGNPGRWEGQKFIPPDANQPRGVRNNNPGNIILGPTKWQGQIEGADPRYATFATPEDGIRALGKNLLAYGDRGLTSVAGIVNRWAPPAENDTKAYVATVAKDLGVDPTAPLNLRDRKVLTQLATSIIKVENGKVAYTPEQIAAGVTAAIENKPAPGGAAVPGDPAGVAQPFMASSIANMSAADVIAVRTGNPIIDNLPADQKIQVFHLARTQANQGMAQVREQMKGRVTDATAALERGLDAPNRPTAAELTSAFGQYDGLKLDQHLANAQAFGNDVRAVGNMPHSQQIVLLTSRQPVPGDGFADAERRHEQLAKAIDRVNTERTQDPALAVLRTNPAAQEAWKALSGVMGNKQADPRAKAEASQMFARTVLAEQQRLEIPNPQILPKAMIDDIAKRFATPPGEGQDTASVMRGIVDQWGPYWPMVGKQLGNKIPAGAVVIGLGVQPEAEQLLSEALKLKPEQLQQGMQPDDVKAVKDLVTSKFDPLKRTLAWQTNGQETYDNYADSATTLALMLVQKGVKPKVAAEKAFESMAGFKYEFEDTWRVPKVALSADSTPTILRGGAHAAKYDIAEGGPATLMVPPAGRPGVRPEDVERQWRDDIKDSGFWVTSPGDGGLTLYVKSGLGAQPVKNADGTPVRRSWDELSAVGNAVRAARYSDVYKKGVRAP